MPYPYWTDEWSRDLDSKRKRCLKNSEKKWLLCAQETWKIYEAGTTGTFIYNFTWYVLPFRNHYDILHVLWVVLPPVISILKFLDLVTLETRFSYIHIQCINIIYRNTCDPHTGGLYQLAYHNSLALISPTDTDYMILYLLSSHLVLRNVPHCFLHIADILWNYY